jgi:UDP-glucose 4-epimerase
MGNKSITNTKGKRYLVTGGAGYIGSNIVKKLLDLGNEVVVLDNESSKYINDPVWYDRALNFKLDVTNFNDTLQAYKGVDYVLHLAAEVRIQESIKNPIRTFEKNVIGTTTVLECARQAGVKRVILSSTSAIYGRNAIPNIETQIDDPLNPYSVSKLSAEKIAKMYYKLYGLETISLRYFNVYGKNHPQKGNYAPVLGIFERQRNNKDPLSINGDGSQKRDFVHIDDIVSANIIASTCNIESRYFGDVFNIGYGKNYSIKEMADMISSNQIFMPSKPGEVGESLANIDKASSVLAWNPTVNIEEYIKYKIML